MSKFHRGDRVCLTDKFASVMMNSKKRRKAIDWRTRQGTVRAQPRENSPCILVQWDGSKSSMSEPRGALEVVK
jgi:hypothetical protein